MNWLKRLVDSTVELESPERFMYFAGLASLSAVVRKNVWINRFSYKLYPNLYIIIVSAKSGLRKGLPVSYAKNLVELAQCTRVISGRNSVQSVLKQLSQQKTLENGTILKSAQAFLAAPELKSFMVGDDQALDILTDLHSVHEHEKDWTNTLKNSPVESLISPCITLFGAANEVMFEALITSKDLEGGFIGRTFIVHESERRSINSLMWAPQFLIPEKDLAEYLIEVSKLKGEFAISNSVRTTYDKWYKHIATIASQDKTGTLERIGDQCLRISMLIALAEKPELVIDPKAMDEAIFRSEEFFSGTKRMSMSGGKAESAEPSKLVIRELIRSKGNELSRKALLNKLFPDVDALGLDQALETLGDIRGTGVVETFKRPGVSGLFYKINPDVLERLKGFEKEEGLIS